MRLIEFFTNLCNRSIAAAYVILTVLVLRLVFVRMKFPRKYSYYLWLIPLIRMICPVSFSSVFSLFNVVKKVPVLSLPDMEYIPFQMQEPGNSAGAGSAASVIQKISEAPDHSLFFSFLLAAYVWLAGIMVFSLYSLISFMRIRRTVKTAVLREENVYECDSIRSPFVLGIFSPKIYVPFRIKESELSYILRHERFHIERKDHIIKLLFFAAAVFYWFHPLIWTAFFCMGRDMEMSCDEKILTEMGEDIKENYSMSLLSFASNRRLPFAGMSGFGETDTKKRVRNILNFRKPKTWIAVLGAVLVSAAAVICLTSSRKDQTVFLKGETLIENHAAADDEAEDVSPEAGDTAVKEPEDAQAFAKKWAEAFCSRDGDTIMTLTTDAARKALKNDEMLSEEEGKSVFGFSSPWPAEDGGSRVLKADEQGAEILYYAWTSDPHLTVWRESLTLQKTEEGFRVSGDAVEEFSQISSLEAFYRAYPGGVISGTMMDYEANGLGEILNQNAKEQRESGYYGGFFSPDWAARCLLNLKMDDASVSVKYMEDTESVQVKFTEDNSAINVQMIRPFGEDGIWIPASAENTENHLLGENTDENISVYGLVSEDGKKDKIKFNAGGNEKIFDCDWNYEGHFNRLQVYERTADETPSLFAFTMMYENTETSEVWRLFLIDGYETQHPELIEFLPEDYMEQARNRTDLVIDNDGVLKIWVDGKVLDKEAVPDGGGADVEAVLLDSLVFMDADDEGVTLYLAAGYQKEGRIIAAARHPIAFHVGYEGVKGHMFIPEEDNAFYGQKDKSSDCKFVLGEAEVDADLNIKFGG